LIETASPTAVRALLKHHGLACRKSLGQNFLVDPNIVRKIIGAAELNKSDLVVEIGPGLGALTTQASVSAGNVLAVEVDRGLLSILAGMLEHAGNVELIQGDALDINFDEMVADKTGGVFGQGGRSYKMLANLPYYITSPLLMHMLVGRFNISMIVIMVQAEVASRLAALPGTKAYGALSVVVNYFTRPKMLFRVPRTVFYPQPGVDSAVVKLKIRPEPAVNVSDERTFFQVVRASFGQRRKTLLNSLSGSGLGFSRDSCLRALNHAKIDPGRRGETLNINEFADLTEALLREII